MKERTLMLCEMDSVFRVQLMSLALNIWPRKLTLPDLETTWYVGPDRPKTGWDGAAIDDG